MFVFGKFSKNLKQISINEISQRVFENQNVKESVIGIIQTRLGRDGVDKEGNKLRTDVAIEQGNPYYSFYTSFLKGNPNNVDLKDTGDFYNSFDIEANRDFFEIFADFDKQDGNIYENFERTYPSFNDFESKILGLSEDELNIFIDRVFLPFFYGIFVSEVKTAIP